MQTLLPIGEPAEASRLPGSSEATTDIHAHYAHDWVSDGGVRANFVASIDGNATQAGRSRGLQTPGDSKVFAALRDLADVVMVGSATAAAEGYGPANPPAERRAIREHYGLGPAPAIAVLSASLDLDLDADLYRKADPSAPTFIITGSAAPLSRRNDIIDLAGSAALQLLEVRSTADGGVDIPAAIQQLRSQGYRRILCEGGPHVFSSAMRARAIDELCLTISPMLVGPRGLGIVAGQHWPADFLPQLRLTGLLVEDDALFCRYRVQG
jgi:riboflavin biosynthesis pyrimidine reductase